MIDSVYSQLLIEYSHDTENRRPIADATVHERGHNPSCGDELELHLKIKDNRIEDAAFTGSGCTISMASGAMMVELVKGNTVEQALEKVEAFLAMIKGEQAAEELEDLLGDASLLSSVKEIPARVKCAVLAWHTLKQALKKG